MAVAVANVFGSIRKVQMKEIKLLRSLHTLARKELWDTKTQDQISALTAIAIILVNPEVPIEESPLGEQLSLAGELASTIKRHRTLLETRAIHQGLTDLVIACHNWFAHPGSRQKIYKLCDQLAFELELGKDGVEVNW